MLFISDFRQFVLASRLDEAQARMALRLSLAGDAEIWIRTQALSTMELEPLLGRLVARFSPKEKELSAINELAEMKRKEDETT